MKAQRFMRRKQPTALEIATAADLALAALYSTAPNKPDELYNRAIKLVSKIKDDPALMRAARRAMS